jgi:hypothetical protein
MSGKLSVDRDHRKSAISARRNDVRRGIDAGRSVASTQCCGACEPKNDNNQKANHDNSSFDRMKRQST